MTTVVGGPAQAAERRAERIERRVLQVRGATGAEADTVWVSPAGRQRSIAAEDGVLRVRDTAGRVVQSVEGGYFAAVDLVSGFSLGGRKVDLAVAADRDRLRVFRVEPNGSLTEVTADGAPRLAGGSSLAGYGRYLVVGHGGTTGLSLLRLQERDGKVGYRVTDALDLPKSFQLPGGAAWSPGTEPQVGRMVVDAEAGVLYAAQADVALWRIQLDHDRFVGVPRIVERTAEYGIPYGPGPSITAVDDTGFRDRIHAAVGAATIYATGESDGYLVVSSQADSKFYVYDRRTNEPITGFQVVDI